MELDSCGSPTPSKLPEQATRISTPLVGSKWIESLSCHPDERFSRYIVEGIQRGFRVGFDSSRCSLATGRGNMVSAELHPDVVTCYIQGEVERGRVVRLNPETGKGLNIHVSPFGVIPKKSNPDKWRLILDLSSPAGHSVNDGIGKELSSLKYVSVDDVVSRVLKVGKGALLAKMDIKQAYRNIPVHPDDRYLLGMEWKNEVYIDTTLPFGLRSAPLIFSAVADALQWVMEKEGVSWLAHYIDDFITVGAPGTLECATNTTIMHEVCEKLGMPVEPDKDEGPATALSFLGLELDTVTLEVRLSVEKMGRLKALLGSWRGRKACKKRDLLSLIGSLTHACRAVKPGRCYLRRLIELSTSARRLDQWVRLNREARSDLEWWYRFISAWNGTAMMRAEVMDAYDVVLTSDASGSWVCGAYAGHNWFMLPWSGKINATHITVKELAPIVIAALVWGRNWRGKTVLAQCDNSATVAIVNSGTSKNPQAMQLRRCLAYLVAMRDFAIKATHIPGVQNGAADALSRNDLSSFRHLCP